MIKLFSLLTVFLGSILLVSCSESSSGNSEVEPLAPTVPHLLEPPAAMMDVAQQQCDEDPDLEQGFVELKDPQTGNIVSRAVVDC